MLAQSAFLVPRGRLTQRKSSRFASERLHLALGCLDYFFSCYWQVDLKYRHSTTSVWVDSFGEHWKKDRTRGSLCNQHYQKHARPKTPSVNSQLMKEIAEGHFTCFVAVHTFIVIFVQVGTQVNHLNFASGIHSKWRTGRKWIELCQQHKQGQELKLSRWQRVVINDHSHPFEDASNIQKGQTVCFICYGAYFDTSPRMSASEVCHQKEGNKFGARNLGGQSS